MVTKDAFHFTESRQCEKQRILYCIRLKCQNTCVRRRPHYESRYILERNVCLELFLFLLKLIRLEVHVVVVYYNDAY